MTDFLSVFYKILLIIFILFPFVAGFVIVNLPKWISKSRSKKAPTFHVRAKVVKHYIRDEQRNGDLYRYHITVFEVLATGDKLSDGSRKMFSKTKVGDEGIIKMKGEILKEFVISSPSRKSERKNKRKNNG